MVWDSRRGDTDMPSCESAEGQRHEKVRCAPMQDKRTYRRHDILYIMCSGPSSSAERQTQTCPARLEVELLRPFRHRTDRCRVAHLAADQPLQRETALCAIAPHHGL